MRLDVWKEGHPEPVGTLDRARDKSLSYAYRPGADPLLRISLALPVREEPYGDAAATAFFGNLLFEGRELDRVREVWGVDRDDVGGLLYHLGADCPGAISVTPEGMGPGKRPGIFPDDYEEVTEAELADIARSLHFSGRLPESTRDPSPVAGVQPKIALVEHEGRFWRPRAASRAPTTHILKVSPQNDPALTRHEAMLLDLARSLGLDTAQTRPLGLGEGRDGRPIAAILSGRFDRVFDNGLVTRVHSEDLCQALGLPRGLKYERDGEGDRRFSAAAVGRLADSMRVPALFRMRFLEQTIFRLGVGDTDNHGKNTAVLFRNGEAEIAPLYDVVPVVLDRRVTHMFAFAHGMAQYAEDFSRADLEHLMRDLGFRKPDMKLVEKLLRRLATEGIGRFSGQDRVLGDAMAAQLATLGQALGLRLDLPERDWFPRAVRDDPPPSTTGWTGMS